MRCNKCGAQIPDDIRFCPVCGNKLQSGRQGGPDAETTPPEGKTPEEPRRLLDFQGWSRPGRGSGRYLEACLYAVVLAAGAVYCLVEGVFWPLYPLIAVLGLLAWRRRL